MAQVAKGETGVDRGKRFQTSSKEVLQIEADVPSKWATLCKDYNPIHISAIAAKLFGFPGSRSRNQVAASMIESIVAAAKTKTKDLWFDSERGSFMEVEFKRPMVVPLYLRVETADVASRDRSKETDKGLEVAYNQIEAWASALQASPRCEGLRR